jgi:uncharacterized SAM-binding protein YcdF (DUF218 family)
MLRRLIRISAWACFIFAVLLLLVYVFRQRLIVASGNLWMLDEPTASADAVVVLGGGAQTRPFAAAELVRQHITTNVLLANVQPTPTDELGVTTRESDASRAVLLKKGVPNSYIHGFGTNVTSTIDEARALRTWALEHHPKVIIISTDLFHTRRVNWLMEKQLHDLNVDVRVIALDTQEYNRTNWWQKEQGIIAFQNELIKYALYRWKY